MRQTSSDGLPDITRLVTHDGGFHADDVLATVVLTRLWPQARLIRTRDRACLAEACADPSSVVYDVGGRFEAALANFDHHQPGAPTRPDGTPFSAFGLVWQAYGQVWLARIGVAAACIAETHARLDRGLVMAVDQVDNGWLSPVEAGLLGELSLPGLLADLAPREDDAAACDAAFAVALPLVETLLVARARRLARLASAREAVLALVAAQPGSPVLELPHGMPFLEALTATDAQHVLFVVHPRAGDWALRAVPVTAGERALRRPLPSAWSGLEHEALAAVCGVADAVFCHRNRFIAAAQSREGALAMAQRALSNAE